VIPTELRMHLLHGHGRTAEEVDRLAAEDLHRLEHVEQEMGLVVLDHHHLHEPPTIPAPRPAGTPTPAGRAPVH
jgi:hypothetical protein